MEYYSRRTKIN